eukprot:TRINITY_DN3704_c0_g1_i1.p1 TRINITY_DN3704_c0_g1~~TRINITY_DN3704_c0_g1_i1.p1  ORF type:complete len:226 (-),score=50.68 TRINITY_DN3704_c0_g1_i1:161-838(-)
MSLLAIERSELYDIFNDNAFSAFVERHLKTVFIEELEEPQDFEVPPVTFTLSPEITRATKTPPMLYTCHLPAMVEPATAQEQKELSMTATSVIPPPAPASAANQALSKQKKPRRTPTNKIAELPKQSRLTITRRTKRNKLVWTQTLQQRFLFALDILGTFDATPSDVLHIMNVEGLTRGNISSHLQKYRGRLQQQEERANDENSRWNISDSLSANMDDQTASIDE